MNTFGEVVGRVYYQAVAAEAVASQPQTTHGASTAQKSSNNPDQGNKSIGPPNDKVSGENAWSSPIIPPSHFDPTMSYVANSLLQVKPTTSHLKISLTPFPASYE
jgi:hypothetical protein